MRGLAIAASVLVVAATLFLGAHRIRRDPAIPFLYDRHGAQWIRIEEPVSLQARWNDLRVHGFRATFSVAEKPDRAVLNLQGMRAASVFLDGECVLDAPGGLERWKEVRTVDLAPRLVPGTHAVRVMVLNRNGPACLIAWCPELNLYTGASWEASDDGKTWTPAVPVCRPHRYEPAQNVKAVPEVFLRRLPIYAMIFCLAFGCSLIVGRAPGIRGYLTPGNVRWCVLGGFLVLGANNLWKLPLDLGFDQDGHFKYIEYVARTWRVPLATEGWQMFQSPLYYLISAPLFRLLESAFPLDTAVRLLRIIPLLCGAAQIELCYRTARRIFPERGDLQIFATILGGWMPMNIYMSQYISNEPLAGLLIGCVMYMTLPLFRDPAAFRVRQCIPLGFMIGLALLAKVTALLVVFPPVLGIARAVFSHDGPVRRRAEQTCAALALLAGVAGLAAGWYYARNWIELGRPFIGGWDASRGIEWWQDPGYRTPAQLLAFGDALIRPVFSGIYSFWDGLYSTVWMDGLLSGMADLTATPRWNYGFVFPGMWFALLPSLAILAGAAGALIRPGKSASTGLLPAALCVGLFLAALLFHFLTNPFYCAVKAFYALGALSSLAVLGAAGLGRLSSWKHSRPLVHALFACWAVSACLGFFAG
ncbi:MAG TPA: hypothetical protein PKO36_08810 [Candidatus Hydrogenedentes bacterium]|nr:hypothetical protein [Candidatus Hydrogenedentota bacterium]HOV72915.1 hypothetical protein [Candidatus Hydrogenedentota bacterium]